MTSLEFKALRKSLGLSAAKMAETLGVCQRSIWYWESGARKIPEPVARLLLFHDPGPPSNLTTAAPLKDRSSPSSPQQPPPAPRHKPA